MLIERFGRLTVAHTLNLHIFHFSAHDHGRGHDDGDHDHDRDHGGDDVRELER